MSEREDTPTNGWKDATFEQAMERLKPFCETLWKKTGDDWSLNINWTFTEPVCPFASISPDFIEKPFPSGCWGDTIPEAIMNAIDAMERDLPEFIASLAPPPPQVQERTDR